MLLLSVLASPVHGARVVDDTGAAVSLDAPPRRIVSLAPHATELLFAAGAGDHVVAVDLSSDYPSEVDALPKLSGINPDLEAVVAQRPDLVVVWDSAVPPWLVARLRATGVAVFVSRLYRLDDIPDAVKRLGVLTGSSAPAERFAARWRARLAALRDSIPSASTRPPVLYQILDHSLVTVTQRHMISEVIQLCGGENVFGAAPGLTLRLDVETVLHRDPEVILAVGDAQLWKEWRERWRDYGARAAREGRLFYLPPELLHRTGPRILDGAERMCSVLAQARER